MRKPTVMTKKNRSLLRKHRVDLVKRLDPDDVINILVSKDALHDRDISKLTSKSIREEKVEYLLDALAGRQDGVYDIFVDALMDTGQEHLAEQLYHSSGNIKVRIKIALF